MVKYIDGTTNFDKSSRVHGQKMTADQLFHNWDTIVYPNDKRVCTGFKIGRDSKVYARIIKPISSPGIFLVQSDFRTGVQLPSRIKIPADRVVTVLYDIEYVPVRKMDRLETTEQLSARIFPLRNHCMAGREQIVNYFNR